MKALTSNLKYSLNNLILLTALLLLQACTKNESPVINLLNPLNEFEIQSGDTLYILAEAWDPDGSINRVDFEINSNIVHSDYSSPYEYFARTYEESLWLLDVIAVDDKDEQSQSPEVKVNILPNEDFIVILQTIPSDPFLGEDISIEVTAVSPFGAIEEVELFINYESFEVITNKPYIFTIDSVQLGSYLINATARDETGISGKSSSKSLNIQTNDSTGIEIWFNNSNVDHIIYNPGELSMVHVDTEDNDSQIKSIKLFFNDSLVASNENTESLSFQWETVRGLYEVYAQAVDDHEMITTSTAKVIEVRNGFLYDGEMAAMVFSEEPDLIFSLNKTYKKLVYIDPVSQIITKDIVLPDFEPLDCKYSMTDKKLYIVSGYSNKITIWDKVSETFQQYPFTESGKGRKITIDPDNRRIYVSDESGISIIHMDNFTFLGFKALEDVVAFEIDPVGRYLFIGTDHFYDSVSKYNVAQDEFDLVWKKNYPSDVMGMKLTPDHQTLILPKMVIPSYFFLESYTSTDFTIVNTSSNFEYRPSAIAFNREGTLIYVSDGLSDNEGWITVMNLPGFEISNKYNLPNAQNTVMSVNYDNSDLTAFSMSYIYMPEETAIYFYNLP